MYAVHSLEQSLCMQYTLWNKVYVYSTLSGTKSMYTVHSLEQVFVYSTLSGTSLFMQYTLWNKSMYAVHSLEQVYVCQQPIIS